MRFLHIFLLLFSNFIAAQLSSKHWIPPIHSRDPSQIEDHYVYLSTPEVNPIQVTITYGDGSPVAGSPFTISQVNPAVVNIGYGQPSRMFLNRVEVNIVKSDKGLILSSTKDFYVSFRMRAQNHSETIISKGITGTGTSFRLGHMVNEVGDPRKNFIASVMATEDNTEITLSDYESSVIFESSSGQITDDSQTFILNEGQSIIFSGYSNLVVNLTGFIGAQLTSTKPVAVNTGNALGGTEMNRADFSLDQIVPSTQIGKEYIFIQGNGLSEMERPLIIADQDNTEVYINGSTTPATTLNAGDFYLVPNAYYQGINNQNIYVETTKPIFAYQLIGGGSDTATCGLNFIPPLSCFFQNSVSIPFVNEIGNTTYNADLMVLTYASATLTVNGTTINANTSQAVQGNSEWVTYRVPNVSGNAQVNSTGPLAVGVFGYLGNASGFAGYYSGFGSAPQDTNLSVCSDRTQNLFDAIIGNPGTGGSWTVPSGGAPLVDDIFDPNINTPGEYIYTFTKDCNASAASFSVKVNVTIEQAPNAGANAQKEICKNDTPIDLFSLLGPNAETGGTWSPVLTSGTGVFDPAVDNTGLYTYTISNSDVCDNVSATVDVIVNTPPLITLINDYIECDNNADGDDTNGQVYFNLNTKTNEVLNGQTGITVTYHLLEADAENDTNGITGVQSGNATIYVRLENNVTHCYSITSFDLVVNPLPSVPASVTLKQCDDDVDAITAFNLTEAYTLISNDATLSYSFYESSANATTNTNPITNLTAYNSTNRTLWVKATNGLGCSSRIVTLNLVVSTTQIPASFMTTLEVCDNFIDTSDPENDGFGYFDLNNATQSIKNQFLTAQQPTLSVTYYETEADALAEQNAIPLTQPYRNTTANNQFVYVRVDSNTSNDCEGLGLHLQLIVNPIPEFDLGNDFQLCVNPVTAIGSQIIDATPTVAGSYSYSWTPVNPDVDGSGNESAQFNVTQAGAYSVLVTNSITGCTETDTINVTLSSEPVSATVIITTPLFHSGLANIQVITTGGYGTYEYSIDGINWQSEPTFIGLENGSYIVQVRDLAHCGITPSEEFFTVSYPNFFTPNGDGYNDTWKIENLPTHYNAKIYIYDRYGKLVKETSSYGKGWDGTFNGNPLPSTDYWFKVEYTEGDITKEFKSHFSLKR
ncbi:T9SS type B sorting domain-containing protein [Flavobacterium sp.]|uniref:T9SS type B sorting domain-containing protein n=1 Tax=Flavobacterium sp. TaxID=239 RepID=UPI0028BDF6E4|nr:T9SS type B sorting domain-containing protein [Flavobacterium sp.]